MAFGFHCIHCNWQELDHGNLGEIDEEDSCIPQEGYKFSLKNCPSYELSEKNAAGEYSFAIEILGEIQSVEDFENLRSCSETQNMPFISDLIHRLKKYHEQITTPTP